MKIEGKISIVGNVIKVQINPAVPDEKTDFAYILRKYFPEIYGRPIRFELTLESAEE